MGVDATAGRATAPQGGARACAASRYRLAREAWVRLLGAVFVAAFASLAVQAPGLWGSQGILPVENLPRIVQERSIGFAEFPSLLRWSASDATLARLPVAGMVAGAAAMLGLFPAPALLLATWLYLSIALAGGVFMSFQWDSLLVEAGFLSVLAAPWGLHPWPGRWPDPPRAGVLAYRVLLAKLMLQSGLVKILSGDPTWRDGTALAYHYQTQPLPTPLAWYAHQLPGWFQRLSTYATLAIELAIPAALLLGRRGRLAAAAANAGLMALVALTGNYTFFNLLTAGLSLWLVDDEAWRGALPALPAMPPLPREPPPPLPRVALALVAGAYSLACLALVGSTLAGRGHAPSWVRAGLRPLRSWRLVNSYGLFAVMTTRRPEIHLEGSDDGVTWRRYVFPYKPGPRERRPGLCAPHQPRLDWQMWFAALSSARRNPWIRNLQVRLLEASPPVLDLFAHDPFEGRPPRMVRAVVDEYRFAPPGSSAWWVAEPVGAYTRTLARRASPGGAP